MADTKKAKVLFLCTSNSARSQMAEALLRKYAGDQFEVFSAGFKPTELHPFAVQVLEEIGLDITGQRSKGVQEYLGFVNFGYLITVCNNDEENCPKTFLGVSQRMYWPFEDPAKAEGTVEERLVVFRRVRDEIDARIRAWLTEMKNPLQSASAPAAQH